nr:Arm DNA-binding domain-containing protein [Bartonella queenslandensis]
MTLMNALKCQRLSQHPRAGKVCDSAGLLLHKSQNGGAQWIYHYTLHGRRGKMGLGAL